MRHIWRLVAIAVLSLTTSASAQPVDQNTRQQIERIVTAYTDNFNKQDAAGIAGLYTKDGVLVTPSPWKIVKTGPQDLSHWDRYEAWQRLRRNPDVVFEPRRIPPELLRIHHVSYAFEICPHGNGLDCHRTWEALLLRTIPVVRTSTLDPLYEGFPVVIISDWEEITSEAMALWRERYAGGFTAAMFERLTRDYWVSRVWDSCGRDPRDARYARHLSGAGQ
jgi:hypothetical protein